MPPNRLTVYLVSCGYRKRELPCAARDLVRLRLVP